VAVLGEDFNGGWLRRLYAPVNPAGAWRAVLVAVGLMILHQLLLATLSASAMLILFDGSFAKRELIKASLVVVFPASLLVALAAWRLARMRGGNPASVLNLRLPRLTALGWAALVVGFMAVMYVVIIVIVLSLGIDLAQYTPGPDGKSPVTGSAGEVKEAMFDIANEPWLFLLVFPSIALGAPIAEEVIFRGQLFSALSLTRLGVSGTAVVTSAIWAVLHWSEPWFSIALIFLMGLAFGWLMYRFGSLWVTIACHGAWNATYAIIIFAAIGRAS
jgi:membrane protease YdiL (CAAX protease family)